MNAINPEIGDKDRFTNACLLAARVFGTNAHYLIAVAYLESGIRNIAAPGSTAFGPFQILDQTWNQYISDPTFGCSPSDRFDPYAQPAVAAKIASDGTAALSEVLPDKRLPTAEELYFVHLFGQHGATEILGISDYNRSIRDGLVRAYGPGPNAVAHADNVINANKQLLTEGGGQARTINAVLDIVGTRLDKGLAVAATMVNAVEPALFSGPPLQQDNAAVPWLPIAQLELAKPVVEGDPIIGNPAIARYFEATTLPHPGPGATPWCGAFVAFCIKQSGIEPGKFAGSARASEWLKFGTALQGPQFGAIAVLDPLVTGSSGHVGFAVRWNAGTVQLLAGNQTTANGAYGVCIRQFDIRHVHGWRTAP